MNDDPRLRPKFFLFDRGGSHKYYFVPCSTQCLRQLFKVNVLSILRTNPMMIEDLHESRCSQADRGGPPLRNQENSDRTAMKNHHRSLKCVQACSRPMCSPPAGVSFIVFLETSCFLAVTILKGIRCKNNEKGDCWDVIASLAFEDRMDPKKIEKRKQQANTSRTRQYAGAVSNQHK